MFRAKGEGGERKGIARNRVGGKRGGAEQLLSSGPPGSNRTESNQMEADGIESNRIESKRSESNRMESNRIESDRTEPRPVYGCVGGKSKTKCENKIALAVSLSRSA